jgi:hypothetical protein
MSIKTNSQEGSVKLNLQNSSTSGLQLGYTGSSQLNLNLPVSYGSSGQVLTTDGSGQLSWSNAGTGGGGGTNGTSGTSGQSGSSGTSGQSGSSGTSGVNGTSGQSGSSGTSGTTPAISSNYFWSGTYLSAQTLAINDSLVGLTVSFESNISGATAAIFDFDGYYNVDYSITIGEKPSGTYNNAMHYMFLKYNGQILGESVSTDTILKHDQDPSGIDALHTRDGHCAIYATAGSKLELWVRNPETVYLRPVNAFTGSVSAKMAVYKID